MERRLWNMLQIIAQFGVERFEEDDRRHHLKGELLDKGFREFEIARMFDWITELKAKPDYHEQWDRLMSANVSEEQLKSSPILSLSERAHGFLNTVRDLGLIDEAMEEDILNTLMLHHRGRIGLEAMRRISAQVIFERQFRAGEDYFGIFEEEWKLLFN